MMTRRRGSIQICDKVIRSKKLGCFKIYKSRDWGKYLVPIKDPEGFELTEDEVNGIELIEDFPKLPKDLWARYIALCFYMCPSGKLHTRYHNAQYEVQVCLLRDYETRSKWKIVVPKQRVSGVSVKSELANNVDIETGEEYTQFPPQGWAHAGSSHSHNTMPAFYSATDDRSELTLPGLHIVVGGINHKTNEYTYQACIVAQKMRKHVEIEDVVDIEPEDYPFHKNVLDYITPLVDANKRLYKKHNTKTKKNSSLISSAWDQIVKMYPVSSEPAAPDFSVPALTDENGDPTPFFNSLDKTNSDLFDEKFDITVQGRTPEDQDLAQGIWYDEEVAAQIHEWIEQDGISVETIYRTLDYESGGRPEPSEEVVEDLA